MYNIHENEVAKLCPHKPTDSVKIFWKLCRLPVMIIINYKEQCEGITMYFNDFWIFWIVDVWTFHCTHEADAQTQTYEGPLWGQNSHPVVGIPGTDSMVRVCTY